MNDPSPAPLPRRAALAVLGGAGALLAGATLGTTRAAAPAAASELDCIETPEILQGPFFVDERLERRDLTEGVRGTPLVLTVQVYAVRGSACSPLAGAHVDVWHADPRGLYSDARALGTQGTHYLRGYQRTNAAGTVSFQTIYPGWYDDRVPHVHLKVRKYDAAGNATHLVATQLYFDDAVSDAVFASGAYAPRGRAKVTTARDPLFDRRTLVRLVRAGGGYTGSFSLGVRARS